MTEKLPKNRKEIFKKFNRFLKDKRIYKAYYRNLYDSRNDSDNAFRVNYCGSMEDFFSRCPASEWLTQCFIWIKQPEGEDFWCNFHKIWSSRFY